LTAVNAPHVLVRSASTSELASVMQLLRLAHPTSSTTAHPPLPSSQIRQAPLGVTRLDITQSQSKPPPDSASRGSSGHELGVPARGQILPAGSGEGRGGSGEGRGGFPVKLGLLLTAVDGMVFLYPPLPPSPLSHTHNTHAHIQPLSLTHTLNLSLSLSHSHSPFFSLLSLSLSVAQCHGLFFFFFLSPLCPCHNSFIFLFPFPPPPPPLSPTHTTHMHTYSRSLTHTLCLSRSLFPTLTLCSSLSCPSLCQSLNVMVSFFVFLFVS